jgi:hypothetical protein
VPPARTVRVSVEAPDIIACADLAERLRRHAPQSLSTGDDGCRVLVPRVPPEALAELLRAVHEWAGVWELPECSLSVDRRRYVLRTGLELAWSEL